MYGTRTLLAISLIVFILLLIPVFALIVGLSFFPILGKSTFTFWHFISLQSTLNLIENTLEFSVVSAAITTVLATTYAWLVARTNVPGKRILELLPILGLTVPILFKAFSWTFMLNQNSGIINSILRLALGASAPVLNIDTMGGLIFVQSFTNVPIVYLITLAAMKSLDPSLEESSRVSGRGVLRTFGSVTIPLVTPAVVSAFLLAIIGGVGAFEFPFILGVPGGVHTLSTEVYFYAQQRVPPSYGSAGYVSVLYAVITIICVSAYIWSTRKSFKFQVVTGRSATAHFQNLGSFRYLGCLICFFILFFEFILPFAGLVLMSSATIFASNLNSVQFNFPAFYLSALKIPLLFNSLRTTLSFGLIAASLATIVGALLSYSALKSKTRGARFADFISAVPLAFPGVIYGVALFWTFLLVPGINLIYGTIWPLVISLVFIRLPFSTRIVSGNMVQISNELEDASQVAGAGFTRTFTRVLMPLIKEGLFNSFVYTLVDSMRELGGVVILATAATPTFTTLLLQYYNERSSQIGAVAAASVMFTGIIVLLLITAAVVRHFWGRTNR
ncbi:MAG: iron ABC transporter permease [Thaumarchaeota archaeon]|nr:iron ABC transporter permease [Nitrososphaerota archaeon]